MSARRLEVYWDFSSPFAYLGCEHAKRIEARGRANSIDAANGSGAKSVDVVWKPMLLGAVFRDVGQVDVPLLALSEAKRNYVLRDLQRWMQLAGISFRFPSKFPQKSVKALRTFMALPTSEQGAFRDRVFRAMWVDDGDIDDDATLRSFLSDDAALKRANDEDIKLALRASTTEAVSRGVFGAPSFIVGSELFWGQDRMPLVERALGLEPSFGYFGRKSAEGEHA